QLALHPVDQAAAPPAGQRFEVPKGCFGSFAGGEEIRNLTYRDAAVTLEFIGLVLLVNDRQPAALTADALHAALPLPAAVAAMPDTQGLPVALDQADEGIAGV